jgi:hypothetical protein
MASRRLEPALASVLAQDPAERGRLNPGLHLTNPPAQSRGLTVNGILKALHKLLEVGDPRFERPQRLLPRPARRGPSALIRIRETATELLDPSDQALTFTHAQRRPVGFGWRASGG